MTLWEVEERLREIVDAHSEDERGRIPNPAGLVDAVDALAQEIERARLLGINSKAATP